jgi:hypothetical protein
VDAQSRAFREARPEDRVADDDLAGHAETVHGPGDHATIRLPEQWEDEQWDAERVGPKSVDEARAQLLARINDPTAPDGAEVAGAYDELAD